MVATSSGAYVGLTVLLLLLKQQRIRASWMVRVMMLVVVGIH